MTNEAIARAIRDQLVDTMREELHNCPDGVVYAVEPELEQCDVDWSKDKTPDGLVLTTEHGQFRVSVAVTPVE